MSALPLSPDKIGLKLATAALVRAVGGYEAAASCCRIGKSALQRQADTRNDANAQDFASIDVIMDLEPRARGQAGWPHVTAELARNLGLALVALPDAEPAERDWHGHIAALSKEAHDLIAGLCAALGNDRIVCRAEAPALEREADELIRVAVNIRAAIQAAREGGRS